MDIIKSKWEKESIQIFHFKVEKKDTQSKKKKKVEKRREVIDYFFDIV